MSLFLLLLLVFLVLSLWLRLLRLLVRGLPFHACKMHQAQQNINVEIPRKIRLQHQIYLTILFNHFLSLRRNIDMMYKLGQNHQETNRNYHASPSPFHQGPYFLKWRFGIVPLLPKQGINRMIGVAGGAPFSADFFGQ